MSVVSSSLGGAASGALAGSAFGPVGAVIGGGIGLLGGFLAGRAQSSAAQAQQRMAMEQLNQARADRMLALQYAGASPQEMAGQNQLLQLQGQVLGRANRELEFLSSGLSSRSPAGAEMGRGLFSEYLMRKREAGRGDLESVLRTRFRSGYATTSASQAALQQYDQGTADLGVQAIPQFLQSAYGAIEAPMKFENLVKGRQVTALTGTPMTQYAGAGNLGAVLGAQNTAADISSLFRTGVSTAISYGLENKKSAWNK